MKREIINRIQQSGPIRFVDFMTMALYDPQQGYYSKSTRQVGREGDFFTSVSVGPLFGQLLARRFAAEWRQLGKPDRWRITECGAHDGRLALDILDTLAEIQPQALNALEYAIAEPLGTLRSAQRKMLEPHLRVLRQITDARELDALPGIVFGNELLDALPCHLVEFRNLQWHDCAVTSKDGDELAWTLLPIADPALLTALEKIGKNFPDGYRTEVRTHHESLLAPLAANLKPGTMIWIDYGFERRDYYHPGRRHGTLRTFDRHQAGENPLTEPGNIDISAHVDFTAVAEAATGLGGKVGRLEHQGNWLTHIAHDWLLQQEGQPDAGALRQFQTLTHPAQLGRSFMVMEIAWS